jgi:uncharacterized protein involved in exopolysaccharide biosynthesis
MDHTNEPHTRGEDELADSGLAGDRLRYRWKKIAVISALGALVGVLVTVIRIPEYAARMSVFFPARTSVLGSNGVMDASAATGSAMLGSGPSPLKIFQAFLESETAIKDISGSFHLSRQTLTDNRAIDSDPRSSVLTVTYVDQDSNRAKRILDNHVAELKRINSKVSFDTMQDDLKVLLARLDEAKSKMKEAESLLVNYERTSISAPTITPGAGGIAATPGTWAQNLIQLQLEEEKIDTTLATSRERVRELSRLSIELPSELPPIKRLRPKLLDTEYELAVKRKLLGPEAPEIEKLEAQLEVTKRELATELRSYLHGVNANLIDPTVAEGEIPALLTSRTVIDSQITVLRRLATAAPAESMEMNRLYARVNLQSGIVQQLTNQYLTATLQSQRDPNRWVILDEPWVNEKPINKSFGRGALVGLVLGFLVGTAWAVSTRL